MRKKGNFHPKKRSSGSSFDSPIKKRITKNPNFKKSTSTVKKDDGLIRLNRFIANAGICSRREADELISAGAVKVNGEIITQMGYKVKPTDRVHYGDRLLKREEMVSLFRRYLIPKATQF